MRAGVVVIGAPATELHADLGERGVQPLVQGFVAQRPLNDSMKVFWIGSPGAM